MLTLCRTKNVYIFNFTIYGERHSGTNFLEQCIKQQFGLDISYFHGFKHWMGFAKPEKIAYDRHMLFIGIVRHPYDWLASFYSAPHHVPRCNTKSFHKFLTEEWYSVDYHGIEIMGDRNYTTKPLQRYKNIFELRRNKSIYLNEVMPVLASNYVLLSYDSFLHNHKQYLNIIGDRFNLKTIGVAPQPISKPLVQLDSKQINVINENIDWSVENALGYFPR